MDEKQRNSIFDRALIRDLRKDFFGRSDVGGKDKEEFLTHFNSLPDEDKALYEQMLKEAIAEVRKVREDPRISKAYEQFRIYDEQASAAANRIFEDPSVTNVIHNISKRQRPLRTPTQDRLRLGLQAGFEGGDPNKYLGLDKVRR